MPLAKMILIAGTVTAITLSRAPRVGVTPIAITPAPKTWTSTGTGRAFLTMAASGFRHRALTGLHIATVDGFGNLIMDGHGFPTSRGVGRRTTMAAGFSIADRGAGGRARYGVIRATIRCGRRLTYRSSASTTVASGSALASATS